MNGQERRTFLQAVIAALSSVIGISIAGSAGTYLFSRDNSAQREAWSDAGDVADFEQDAPQEVTFEKRRPDGWNLQSEKASAWVVRNGEGSITAFSPWCTHLGCAYHWEPEKGQPEKGEPRKGQFICPCHGSRFDSQGSVIAGPAIRPLDRYRTRLEGSRVWILPLDPPSGS